MIRRLIKISLLMSLCLCAFTSKAQIIYSPYTAQGLGDVAPTGVTSNLGMAGLGISYGTIWNLNIINPALLVKNSNFTTFQVGLATDLRRLEDNAGTQTTYEGGLNYALLGVPLIRDRWVSAVGYRPLTVVNYNVNTVTPIAGGGGVPTQVIGRGGLSEAFWSHGVKLNRNFSLGVQVSYIFGNITETRVPDVINETGTFFTNNSQLSVSSLSYAVGGLYNGKIGEETFLNIGGGYSFEGDYNATNLVTAERSLGGLPLTDTLSNVDGQITYPLSTYGGISFEKKYNWVIGVNYRYQNWEAFQNVDGSNEGLNNSNLWILGSEWTPDINDINNYFKRMTYRFGVRYKQTQFESNGKQVDDFGISFGLGLPVMRASYANIGLWLGRRGWDSGQLQENYIRGFIGFTFNDKWFIRRKYN